MKWNLKELRGFLKRLFVENQLRTFNQFLRTLDDRRSFSRHRFNDEAELMAAVLAPYDTDKRQFSTARLRHMRTRLLASKACTQLSITWFTFLIMSWGLISIRQPALKRDAISRGQE